MSQVISPRLSAFPSPAVPTQSTFSRSNPARYAQKRDREVPYGMKGGEHSMASKKGGKASSKKSSGSSKKTAKKK